MTYFLLLVSVCLLSLATPAWGESVKHKAQGLATLAETFEVQANTAGCAVLEPHLRNAEVDAAVRSWLETFEVQANTAGCAVLEPHLRNAEVDAAVRSWLTVDAEQVRARMRQLAECPQPQETSE